MLHRTLRAIICAALLATVPGCSSLLAPRPHKLMKTTREIVAAAPYAAALPRELEKQVLPDYRVAPGDVVLVEPVDFNSSVRLPADQKVQPDGKIDLGQYGRIVVTGMSLDEIRIAVEGKVAAKEGQAEAVQVRLTEPESQVYYVIGEVNSPAAYPVVGRETVLDAILAAGGLTDNADRHSIIFSRPTAPSSCRSVLPICYRHIVELGDASTNYQVMPGDRIFVPSVPLQAEIHRTLFPSSGERCPRCSGAPVACPPGSVGVASEQPHIAPPGVSGAGSKKIIHHQAQATSPRRPKSFTSLSSYLR